MYNSVQWRIIARELARTGGVASQAARNLRGTSSAFKGLSSATLYRLRRHPKFKQLEEKLNLSVVNGIEDAERDVEKRKGLEAVDPDNPAVVIPRQLLDKVLAEALQAARDNHATVEVTALIKLFGLYTKGLQTLCRK
ncbi:MAG: hypothetical protein ABSE73_00675 [Planctomycetota bacterium]